MGRGKIYTVHRGTYGECMICGYEVKNNREALKLHVKYSHPDKVFEETKHDISRCGICKKENCKIH